MLSQLQYMLQLNDRKWRQRYETFATLLSFWIIFITRLLSGTELRSLLTEERYMLWVKSYFIHYSCCILQDLRKVTMKKKKKKKKKKKGEEKKIVGL